MDGQATLRVRDEAGFSVDVGGAGGGGVCEHGVASADRGVVVVTLPAGADHAPVAPYPGARIHALRLKIERIKAEVERIERSPIGDWKEVAGELNRLIAVCERQLAHVR